MPTVFGAYSVANINHSLKKSRANNYLAGTKLSWFSSVGSVEMLGSYGFFKTYNHSEAYGRNNLKSHLFSLGSKFSFNRLI
ncbi:MAG: hypothetical protein LBU35_02465 [Holosporales bacterium]|jgi:hypothetical protein|nr:hypothetical protein [Holosporales bacterium]